MKRNPKASCNNRGCDWKTEADGTWRGAQRLAEMHLNGAHGREGTVRFAGTVPPVNAFRDPTYREWDEGHYGLHVGRTNNPPR